MNFSDVDGVVDSSVNASVIQEDDILAQMELDVLTAENVQYDDVLFDVLVDQETRAPKIENNDTTAIDMMIRITMMTPMTLDLQMILISFLLTLIVVLHT
ncbi:hypothetical protein L6452_01533 [Arctium lappa]|uniref:Uncharacterized protein n=1 Tax=Arctium lappa TaxID=4217 RepID=A0ACB9FHS9_ARCLA|nr:hypothetical protein L6452_01533 [Arctium lappa]